MLQKWLISWGKAHAPSNGISEYSSIETYNCSTQLVRKQLIDFGADINFQYYNKTIRKSICIYRERYYNYKLILIKILNFSLYICQSLKMTTSLYID